MNKTAVGIGEVLWGLLPEGKKLGGAPANFACHVSQFGFDSRIVSAVGHDPLGLEIQETLRVKGLECLFEAVPYPTGTVQAEVDAEGVPRYDIRTDVAWDHIPFTPRLEVLAAQAQAVCFGSLAQRLAFSRETIHRFLDAMPDDGGRLKIFDINLRQTFYDKEILHRGLQKCNILKLNDEEAGLVGAVFNLPGHTPPDRCRFLLKQYPLKMVLLTCGTKGSYVFTPGATSFLETPRVEVADTVGAGDSFTAAFTAALLHGKSVAEAHRLAVEVSAYVCAAGTAPCPDSPNGWLPWGAKPEAVREKTPCRRNACTFTAGLGSSKQLLSRPRRERAGS